MKSSTIESPSISGTFLNKILAIYFFSLLFVVSASAQPMWAPTGGPGESRNLEINFDSSGGVYVMTGWYGHCDRIFRTTDAGNSWATLPLPKGPSFNLRTLSNGHLILQIGDAIQVSTDAGQTWTPIIKVPMPHDSSVDIMGNINSAGTSTLHVETTSGEIFVWFGSHTYRSADEGSNWDTLPGPPYYASGLFAFYSPTLFLTGNNGYLYRSTDNGESWGRVVNGLPDGAWRLGCSPNGVMYCETEPSGPGVSVSIDDGRTWRLKFPLRDLSLFAVTKQGLFAVPDDGAIDLIDSSNNLIDAIQGGYAWASSDGPFTVSPTGQLWFVGPVCAGPHSTEPEKYVQLPAGRVESLNYFGGDTILAGMGNVSYFLTTDGGKTWRDAKNNTDYSLWYKKVAGSIFYINQQPFLIAPNSYQYLGTSTGIYRSTDGGGSWDNLNLGLTSISIACLAVDSAGNLFTATNEGIYRSTDDALHWKRLNYTMSGKSGISSLVINTSGDVVAVEKDAGIFWSQDTGATWGPIGTGLAGTVNCMLSTPSGHVFAGTNKGVYYLAKGGSSWVNANDGLTNLNVLSITRDSAGTVYLGTDGDGMFRSVAKYNYSYSSSVQEASIQMNDLSISSIFPNPVASSTKVSFVLSEPSEIKLELVNVLGQPVKTIASGYHLAGAFTSELESDQIPNGIYHVRLQAGAKQVSRSLVIAR